MDDMLAHNTFGEVEGRYNKATFLDARRRIACAWADQLLAGSPSAFAVAGLVELDRQRHSTEGGGIMWLPNDIIADVDRVARIYYVAVVDTKL